MAYGGQVTVIHGGAAGLDFGSVKLLVISVREGVTDNSEGAVHVLPATTCDPTGPCSRQ